MITYNNDDFNVDINRYSEYVANLEVSTLKYPNCSNCNFERHSYYKRYIIKNDTKVYIKILRVKCNSCGKTHAILPSFVVPYLHTPIIELKTILVNHDKKEKLDLEPHKKKLYKKIYKAWVEKLKSLYASF